MKEKLLAIRLRIKTDRGYSRYVACYTYPGGRIEQTLLMDGKPVVAAPNARVIKGLVIEGETPLQIAQIWNAAGIQSNQLSDEGALSVNGRIKFKAAMEKYLEWRKEHRAESSFVYHAKYPTKKFGNIRLNKISRTMVDDWIQTDLVPNFAHKTIQHRVGTGKELYNWLIKRNEWSGSNPFASHEWKTEIEGTGELIKYTVSPEEFALICNLSEGDKRLIQAIMLGYYIGVRPTEIYGVLPEDFNHDELTLRIFPSKRRGKKHQRDTKPRLVAIPQILSDWVIKNRDNWKILNESTVQGKIEKKLQGHPALENLTMESFRRNYISMMELAGTPLEYVEAHQGRYQSSVSKSTYLKDTYRVVKLMRPFVNKVFGEDTKALRVIK